MNQRRINRLERELRMMLPLRDALDLSHVEYERINTRVQRLLKLYEEAKGERFQIASYETRGDGK